MLTFADLEQDENPTAEVLKAFLLDYAEEGYGISPREVIRIINRIPLSDDDKLQLHQSAQKGVEEQKRRKDKRCAAKYDQIVRHLSS
jgi:hypothetical protein